MRYSLGNRLAWPKEFDRNSGCYCTGPKFGREGDRPGKDSIPAHYIALPFHLICFTRAVQLSKERRVSQPCRDAGIIMHLIRPLLVCSRARIQPPFRRDPKAL